MGKEWVGWFRAFAVGCGLLALLGCANDPPDTVASAKGWRISSSQLKSEWERTHPETSYDTTSVAVRTDFVRTLADKEILLRLARENCPKPDPLRARSQRITYEKTLQRDFQTARRQAFALSLQGMDERLRKLSRVAHVMSANFPGKAVAQQAAAEIAAGQSLESVATKYARGAMPGAKPGAIEQRLRAGQTPWMLLAAVMLEDVPAGTISRPIETNSGFYIVKVLDYEPFDLNSEPGLIDRAKQNLSDLAFMPHNQAYVDSLKKASGIAFHTENDSLVAVAMSTFWDSVQVAVDKGQAVNYQTLRGPAWLVKKEDAAKPCFDLAGKTYSVSEFIRSLDDVDLDSWPTVGPMNKITYQIQNRVFRMMFNNEAERTGMQNRPDFVARMKRVEEKGLLDQFRDTVLLPQSEPTEAELRAHFEARGKEYVTADMGSFGLMIFPKDKEERAKQVLAKLRAGDPSLWYELGPQEQQLDRRIQLYSDTKEVDLNGAPPVDASWDPFMKVAIGLDTGQISEPVHTQHGVTLVRVAHREHRRQMTFEEAKANAITYVRDEKADKKVEAMLESARKKWGVKIYAERLAGGQS